MDERFAAAMAALAQSGAHWPGAVGVSGGSDSLALMVLLARWAERQNVAAPVVLTVDHRLQPHSARQARTVVAQAGALGLAAQPLVWRGAKPASDIEAAARQARYALMGRCCRQLGIANLYLAHTKDDQAETFLLRLARGSGLDGLSAMRGRAAFPVSGFGGIDVLRPLLGFSRAELRNVLVSTGIAWHEDPMNADERFARVRLRKAWPSFAAAGLTAARIADAAAHLARARSALEDATATLLACASRSEEDRIIADRLAIVAAPREIGLRALSQLLIGVSGQAYRPRFARLEALFDALARPKFTARTLHGCRVYPAPKRLSVFGPGTIILEKEPLRRGTAARERK